jgi:spermidine synthase
MNHDIASDPRVRMLSNDGRNHLLLSRRDYDVITCDPVHPLYGSAPLYSIDFFRLCRSRLRSGGLVCQYLPLHRMPTPEFRRAIATFRSVFEESWVLFSLGHAVLVGGNDPLQLDWNRWQSILDRHPLRQDLAASALATPAQIAVLFHLGPEAADELAAGEPSSDLHPHLEFLLPAAYTPGLWRANARFLVEHYRSPIDRIEGLPESLREELRRLVAGKRLLLFSLLERDAGNAEGTLHWLRQALTIAGDDPELRFYARQVRAELEGAKY